MDDMIAHRPLATEILGNHVPCNTVAGSVSFLSSCETVVSLTDLPDLLFQTEANNFDPPASIIKKL